MAGLSICNGLDYGSGCSWRESALTPVYLSLPTQSHTHREREGENTGGVAAGQGDTGLALEGVAGTDVTIFFTVIAICIPNTFSMIVLLILQYAWMGRFDFQ